VQSKHMHILPVGKSLAHELSLHTLLSRAVECLGMPVVASMQVWDCGHCMSSLLGAGLCSVLADGDGGMER
jgi:hypothetical protein